MLDRTLETKTFTDVAAGMSLRDFVGLLHDVFLKHQGIDLPLLVEFEAFKAENPDVYKEEADPLNEVKVTISAVPRRLSLRRILEQALAKIPTCNATYIVRKDAIEITTVGRATSGVLINTPVAVLFNNRRLVEALRELSGLTGAAIVASPRVATQLDARVTATLANNVPLKTAVRILAEMADLKVVELEGGLYITTPENAEALGKEIKSREREGVWRKRHKIPDPNPIFDPNAAADL